MKIKRAAFIDWSCCGLMAVAFFITAPSVRAQKCTNVAGPWIASGDISANVTAQGNTVPGVFAVAPNQVVVLQQNGCAFSFNLSATGPDGLVLNGTYAGTLSGTNVQVTAKTPIPVQVPGGGVANFSGKATAYGPFVGGVMYLTNGSFTLSTVYQAASAGLTGTPNIILRPATPLPPPPTVSSPANNSTTGNPTVNVAGREGTNEGLAAIYFQVNGGATQSAQVSNKGMNWAATISLQPGTNEFLVWASNALGQSSPVPAFYVLNPFISLVGSYNGIFYPPNPQGEAVVNSGYLTMTLTPTRKFTGKIWLNGASIPCTGQLDTNGAGHFSAGTAASGTLQVTVQLDLSGSGLLTGTVENLAAGWTANLTARTGGFTAASPATNFAGTYLLAMNGSANTAEAPAGYSYATVTITPTGAVSAKGVLADGTPITPTGVLSKDGNWLLFNSLYSGKGSVMGWVKFAGHSAQSQAVTGEPFWFKGPIASSPYYKSGFSLVQGDLEWTGNIFTAPGRGIPVLPVGGYDLQIFGGGLVASISNNITISANNAVSFSANTNHLSITLNAAKGSFTGSFIHPITRKQTTLNGILIPEIEAGYGYFLGAGEGGGVLITRP
jgi:hypothetical protein